MRLDKLLWYLRFAKTRSAAQALAGTGHIRLNGHRAMRPAQPVAAGDIMVLPLAEGVRIIEIVVLPERRGPAAEAAACYRTLDGARSNHIAADGTKPEPHRPINNHTKYQGDPSL